MEIDSKIGTVLTLLVELVKSKLLIPVIAYIEVVIVGKALLGYVVITLGLVIYNI